MPRGGRSKLLKTRPFPLIPEGICLPELRHLGHQGGIRVHRDAISSARHNCQGAVAPSIEGADLAKRTPRTLFRVRPMQAIVQNS